ncbi:transcriptional regulator NrdR [Tersicoccus sp. Bi-70]|uniref:transcriptional regulator NrdR n=1 Tax=Tersicoccus sp. Bi-70 TaxID=1897634 RepID=UPI0009F85B81|nr:transcriptional regulator NrdR [Tersicoccus sp. Bi-70]
MNCPFCRSADSRVVDSRIVDEGASIRRRRLCSNCGKRFSTLETTSLTVLKRSGVAEPFSRNKVISGVRKACQGRPVTEDDLAMLAQEVEESIRAAGAAEIDAHDVGLAILRPLQRLDVIAYLRFASVYQSFESLEDFEQAISLLRHEADVAAGQTHFDEALASVLPEREEPASPAKKPRKRRTSAGTADQGGLF